MAQSMFTSEKWNEFLALWWVEMSSSFFIWSFHVEFQAGWCSSVHVIGTQECPGINGWFTQHLVTSLYWSSVTFASYGFKQEEILQNQYSEMLHMQVRFSGRGSSSLGDSLLTEFHWGVEWKEGTVGRRHFAELTVVLFIPIKKKSISGVFAVANMRYSVMWHLFSFPSYFTSNTLIFDDY